MNAAPAKSAKRVAKKTEETPAPVATPAAPAAPAAAPAKKAKAAKAAEAAPAPAAPVAAPAAPAPASTEVAAAAATEEVRLESEVKSVTARLLAVRETVSELISEAKRLEKRAAKLQKVADKRRRRSKAAEGEEGKPARVSIFQVPVNISPALCSFLGRPAGSQESRSNVTKAITSYVKDHNLKSTTSDKHTINADAKLKSLLGLKEGDKLTYFNLQKYLNVHYIKNTPTA
jgi:chromatin remodeling complex protein RSC6